MSYSALRPAGADLDQALEPATDVLREIESEAHWLADLAGRFGLFGLALHHEELEAFTIAGAEEAYLDATPAPEAANESAPEANAKPLAEAETSTISSTEEAHVDAVSAPEAANETALTETNADPIVEIETPPLALRSVTEFVAQIVARSPAAEASELTEPSEPTLQALTRAAFPNLKPRRFRVAPLHAMRAMQALDWAVALGAAQAAALWGNGEGLSALTVAQAAPFLLAAGSLKAGLWLTDLYRTAPGKLRAEQGAGGLALGVVAGLVIAAFFAPDARSAAALSATLPLAALVLAAAHAAFALWMSALHKNGAFSETIVLVGATEGAERLARRAAARGDARIVAIVDDRLSRAPQTVAGAPVTGSIEELLRWESLPHVDRIVVTVTQKAEHRVRGMIEKLRLAPNRIDLLLDYDTISVRGRKLDRLTGAAMACVSGRPHHAGRALLKRAQDLVFASLLTLVFAPVMALIALGVKLDSKGPAIYRQRRHGFNNRIITVYKFRTMSHEPGAALKQVETNDPRITRIGQFLRRTSLDELPQLLNVLKGDMSLVGPRPHAVGMRAADRDLSHIVAEYAHRHQVKPGITGWAQINGSRGPINTPAAVRERVRLDLDYVSRASFWFDVAILLRTAPSLLGDSKTTR